MADGPKDVSAQGASVPRDTDAALDFLGLLRPDGPWVLTAIVPDGAIETATFDDRQQAGMAGWVEARQGKKNLYYSLNPTRRALTSKASKEDIAAVEYLHVDCDPMENEKVADAKLRLLPMLQNYDPPPTAIVDSGS